MVSAVLAYALELGGDIHSLNMEVEHDDIVASAPSLPSDKIRIDITSTSGIWKKPLKSRRMIAISKYDLGAIFTLHDIRRVSSSFALAIMNSLAVEHTAYYGLPDYVNLVPDLELHYKISDKLHSFSQRTIQELSEMSYHALIAESVSEAIDMDPFPKGQEYTTKAQKLKQGILGLDHDQNVAVPPYPISEIIDLDHGPTHLELGSHELYIPTKTQMITTHSADFSTPDRKRFLKEFKAKGIFPKDDAWEFCTNLQEKVLKVNGLSHRGPIHDVQSNDPVGGLWDLASEMYAQSSVAQFCEIRADIIRQIDLATAPTVNKWKSSLIYKGKVILWYSLRDQVTDARGYRVDWFAVSAFNTIGAVNISNDPSKPLYLWPRQRLRSQEMELAAMAPRRLKLTLFSMLEKSKATRAGIWQIYLAWQKLALTVSSATWASGATYVTARHLSSSFCSPSTPFDSMVSKFCPARTLACVVYYTSIIQAVDQWDTRDKYHNKCALLGLPRAFSQLEAYWQVWVPDEFADTNKNMTDCALALFDEVELLNSTFDARYADSMDQMVLLSQTTVTIEEIRDSIRQSCSLDTGGKLGWSVFGSLASAHALSIDGDVARFDREFSKGNRSRRLVDHLTVRHSARISPSKKLETGTVAEMILANGVDDYLSILKPTFRFFYGVDPIYVNHPKLGEHKKREISMADPDSRIMLNNAELINGSYGRYTKPDMLKRPNKDAHFYKLSSEAMLKGGAIQASDASRFSAMMSNIATGITNLGLAAIGGSTHLYSSAATYRRLASRRMALSTEILEEVTKREERGLGSKRLSRFKKWLVRMPMLGKHESYTIKGYRTAVHTGQGMSHHGTSLAHGGALVLSLHAAEHAILFVSGKRAYVAGIPMVTSDDSTIIAGIDETKQEIPLTRHEKQRACQLFLKVQRVTRRIALRSVSVMPNLPKEKVSGIAGEFNSQDNGIGAGCPILGFREMICQLTRPSSPSLCGDYMNAFAYARSAALNGQGLTVGKYAHLIALDTLEARWRMSSTEKESLDSCGLIPNAVIHGADENDLLHDPASLVPAALRVSLMQMSYDMHMESEVLSPHAKDTTFSVLSHISVSMRRQHKHALSVIKARIERLKQNGLPFQASMLEQSLGATMSSARSRNIGRIGQRIRNRLIKPSPCLECEFQKAPLLETTLSWYSFISSKSQSYGASPEIQVLGQIYGGYVKCIKGTYIRFPEPVTKRRSKATNVKKPVFILEPYGSTPFGRHAISRSGGQLVTNIGPEERGQMQLALAASSYRRVPEHIQYGGKFVSSWLHRDSCTLSPVSEGIDFSPQITQNTYWGEMDDASIAFLRDCELVTPDIPVLALNYAYGNTAHFHGIYKGKSYSCSTEFDPDVQVQYTIEPGMARGGQKVVLAYQGWSLEKRWHGSGPSGSEIESFQNLPNIPYDNSDMERLSKEMEREDRLKVPLLATIMERESKKILVMSASNMSRDVHVSMLPYERSKMVGNLATGGYWYSALKGVGFRAFIKGHHGFDNLWTGPVMGWRSARVPDPVYEWEPPDGGLVKSLTMIGGIDNEEDISVLNPTEFASAHVYVDTGGMHMVDEVYNLPYSRNLKALITKLNGGGALFTNLNRKAELIDTMLPEMRDTRSELDNERCEEEIWSLITGNRTMYDGW